MNPSTTTLSSKNQITIPIEFVRELHLSPGAKFIVQKEGDHIVLIPRPEDIVDAIMGSTKNLYGKTPEEADQYIREERANYGEIA